MLRIWKMAADFQNVHRYNVSWLVGSVGGRFRTQQQPCRWKRITFCGRYLCFSSVLPPELRRGEKSVDADCWFPWRNVDAAAAWKKKLSPSPKRKKTISKSSDKTSSTRGSSDAMFLVDNDMYPDPGPAHWHPKIPIKWYGSIYFVSLVEKKSAVPFVQKKPPKIPFKW